MVTMKASGGGGEVSKHRAYLEDDKEGKNPIAPNKQDVMVR